MTLISTSFLSDIQRVGRMKYLESHYSAQATSSQLKNEIKHLIDTGKITKEVIKKKIGTKYSTFVYLSIKEQ